MTMKTDFRHTAGCAVARSTATAPGAPRRRPVAPERAERVRPALETLGASYETLRNLGELRERAERHGLVASSPAPLAAATAIPLSAPGVIALEGAAAALGIVVAIPVEILVGATVLVGLLAYALASRPIDPVGRGGGPSGPDGNELDEATRRQKEAREADRVPRELAEKADRVVPPAEIDPARRLKDLEEGKLPRMEPE